MSNYVIITDSTSDLSLEQYEKLNVDVIPLKYRINEKDYVNDLENRDLPSKEYFDLIRNGKLAITSQVNSSEYCETFEKYLKQGLDVIHIALSSGISGSYNSSLIAVKKLKEKYKDRKIVSIDSLSASGGEGLLVSLACQKRKQGLNFDSLVKYIEGIKLNVCHWFMVEDLFHLKKSGRVSYVSAFFGTMLNIKPVLHVNNIGKLIPIFKSRGKKAAINTMVDQMKKTIKTESKTIFINHADDIESAQNLAKIIKMTFGKKDVIINNIGAVIGAHSGPGTVALFFIGSKR